MLILDRVPRLYVVTVLILAFGIIPRYRAIDSDNLIAQLTHTSWTASDGIPGTVRAIVQTPDGYLWLGTEAGLYRFDGLHFLAWEPTDGERMPSSSVLALCVSHDGNLWIGFTSGVISRLSDGRLKNFKPHLVERSKRLWEYLLGSGGEKSVITAVRWYPRAKGVSRVVAAD